jgi:hypothetical protein
MLRKQRRIETTARMVLDGQAAIAPAILFSHNHLSAVTKVMFPTIKLVRPLLVAG